MGDADDAAPTVLGPLERRVMSWLWQAGPQSVAEVVNALNWSSDRQLAYTTVMTILVRLHDKAFVTRQKHGRHYRYAAVVEESSLEAEVGRRQLSRLLERYGVTSVAGFAAELGEGDLADRLRKLARERGETA